MQDERVVHQPKQGGWEVALEFKETQIYPFIAGHPDGYRLIHVEKGTNFCPAYDSSYPIWYLVSGVVDDCATSHRGRTIIVDTNFDDEFTGHLSNHYGQNFYCSSIARTPCDLVRISPRFFNETLMKDPGFRMLFYFKTSVRLYEMFKLNLTYDLFSDKRVFSYWLMENARDGVCEISSASTTSKKLKMSRRNFYNILSKLKEYGIIERSSPNEITIVDQDALEELAAPVSAFMNNEL